MHPDIRAQTQTHIEIHGHSIVGVFPTGPGQTHFSYSIGLRERDGFELLMEGIDTKYGAYFINTLAQETKARNLPLNHACIIHGMTTKPEFRLALVPCHELVKDERTVQAGQYYGHEDYGVLQLVMCDPEGRMPWEPDYDDEAMRGQELHFDVTAIDASEWPEYDLG